MGASAQVRERTLGVKGDTSVFQAFKQFQFVRIALALKIGYGFGLGYFTALKSRRSAGQFQHFFLHFGEIIAGKSMVPKIDIVIKTLLNGRPNPQSNPGVQSLQGLRQKVGTRMPKRRTRTGFIPFEQTKAGCFGKTSLQIPDFTVHLRRKNLSGQAFR